MAGVNAVYRIPSRSTGSIGWTEPGYMPVDLDLSEIITLERGEAFNRGYPLIRTFVRARFVVISWSKINVPRLRIIAGAYIDTV